MSSLEKLEPVINTRTMIRQDMERQRYVINASHSKRLSGEYDSDIERIFTEEKSKLDSYKQSVEMKRAQRSMGLSHSMPFLSAAGAASAECGRVSPSSQPMNRSKRSKANVEFSSEGVSSECDSPYPGGLSTTVVVDEHESEEVVIVDDSGEPATMSVGRSKKTRVSIDATIQAFSSDAGSQAPKTPHPSKIKASCSFEIGADVEDQQPTEDVQAEADAQKKEQSAVATCKSCGNTGVDFFTRIATSSPPHCSHSQRIQLITCASMTTRGGVVLDSTISCIFVHLLFLSLSAFFAAFTTGHASVLLYFSFPPRVAQPPLPALPVPALPVLPVTDLAPSIEAQKHRASFPLPHPVFHVGLDDWVCVGELVDDHVPLRAFPPVVVFPTVVEGVLPRLQSEKFYPLAALLR